MDRNVELRVTHPELYYELQITFSPEDTYAIAGLRHCDDANEAMELGWFEDGGAGVKFVPFITNELEFEDTFKGYLKCFSDDDDDVAKDWSALNEDLRIKVPERLLSVLFLRRRAVPFGIGAFEHETEDWRLTIYPNSSVSVMNLVTGMRISDVFRVVWIYDDDGDLDTPFRIGAPSTLTHALVEFETLSSDWSWFGMPEDARAPEAFEDLWASLFRACKAACLAWNEHLFSARVEPIALKAPAFGAVISGTEVNVIAHSVVDTVTTYLSLERGGVIALAVFSLARVNGRPRVSLCPPEIITVPQIAKVLGVPEADIFEDFDAFISQITEAITACLELKPANRVPARRRC